MEEAKEEVRDTLNRTQITTYPLFEDCKSSELASIAIQKKCFFEKATSHIYAYLGKEHLVVTQSIQDTLYLKIEVSKTGKFKLLKVENTENLEEELQSLNSICNEAVESIPKLDYPANKNGVDIAITFTVPLVLTSIKSE